MAAKITLRGVELEPRTDESIAFLRMWPTPFVHLTAIRVDAETGQKKGIEAKAFGRDRDGGVDWPAVAKWIDARQGKANLYFTVNALMRPLDKKAEKADVSRVIALHVDVDVEKGGDQASGAEGIVERLQAHEPPPSFVIMSGGGGQGFWCLAEDQYLSIQGNDDAAENAERYVRALEEVFGADPCHNVDRIMRLPGTINIPDVKKIDKGRAPSVSRLAFAEPGRVYQIAQFAQAAPKMDTSASAGAGVDGGGAQSASSGKKKTRVKVDISWEGARALYRDASISLPALRERGVEEHAILSLQHGDNLDRLHEEHAKIGHRVAEGPYGSFSLITLAIATALLKADMTPEETAAIMGDPQYPGNKHVTRQAAEREKHRAIQRAMEYAAGQMIDRDARRKATAVGMPVWLGGCKDEAGLYPFPNLKNTQVAINALEIQARYDLFHDKVILTYMGTDEYLSESVGGIVSMAETAIRQMMSDKWDYDPGGVLLHDALFGLATQRAFNPITDYLDECQGNWDGVQRLDTWVVKYLGCEDTPLNRAIGACHLKAAVRRARSPGCKYDPICVLEGHEGTEKSKAIEILAGKENFSDQTILGVTDREQMENCKGRWLYEIADLAGMNRAEVEHVKAFASRTTDRARAAYGRAVEDFARALVFFATTNNRNYMLSQTGNRRLLPLATTVIDIEGLTRDRDQIWAEAAVREAAGERIELPRELWAAARDEQDKRRQVDEWENDLAVIPEKIETRNQAGDRIVVRIVHYADGLNGKREARVVTSDLLTHVLRVNPGAKNVSHGIRLSNVMGKLGWQRTDVGTLRVNGAVVRGYYRELLEGEESASAERRPEELIVRRMASQTEFHAGSVPF